MAVKEILQIGNPILRSQSINIDFEKDPFNQYLEDLTDTLHHFQKKEKIGRAIAGPQIGICKNIICMDSGDRSITMINPVITQKSEDMFEVWDSCFSADVAFFGKTARYKDITVEYYDEKGRKVREDFSGDLSELFQHEIDHLRGILFTDHIINNQIIMRKEWEKL